MAFVERRADNSECVKYDYDGYYAYIRQGFLSSYQNYAADSHWHDDLEFISVLEGEMDYNINGEIIRLHAGQGIVVNAKQIHYGFSEEKKECVFYCLLLHPMLLCITQNVDRDFVAPILSNETIPYVLMNSEVEWHRQVLEDIEAIYWCRTKENAPLHVQYYFYHIWILIGENICRIKQIERKDRNLSVLKNMLSYIQKTYMDNVLLKDIAAAGGVSISTCFVIFRRYLQDTPTSYLIAYRLKRAIKLLENTDESITEIALEVGFCSASYFSETFRSHFGCSPRAYRRNRVKEGG